MFKLKNLSRRQLLSLMGGAAAANALAPLVPRVEAAEADIDDLSRYSYWFEFVMPIDANLVDENYQNNFGPLAFKNGFSALNDTMIRDKLVFLRNVKRTTSDGGDGPHPSGVAGITGWKGGGNGRYNRSATSVDQYLSGKFTGRSTIADIRAGYKNEGKDGDYDRSTSVINGSIKTRHQSPVALYNDVFKDVSGGGGLSEDIVRQRKSVLDNMRGTINALSKKVSHFDKQRIDQHLSAIRATETKLENILENVGSCETNEPTVGANASPDKVYPVYSELMAQAFACNLTRVAGAHYGSAASRIAYEHLSSYDGGGYFHNATHGKHSGPRYLRDVLQFRAEQVTYYLKTLEGIVEPNGKTLLDNTFFFWTSDVARKHDNRDDMLCILAGATGRLKQHGNMVNANGVNHNDILTTITHFMGEPVNKYGDPAHGSGVMPQGLFS